MDEYNFYCAPSWEIAEAFASNHHDVLGPRRGKDCVVIGVKSDEKIKLEKDVLQISQEEGRRACGRFAGVFKRISDVREKAMLNPNNTGFMHPAFQ